MKRTILPYLETKTVKGRVYIYFRRAAPNGKSDRIRLPDDIESEAFSQAYWSIRNGAAKPAVKTSWGNLIVSYYQSPGFKALSPGTRANYRRHCEAIREKNATKDMRTFRRANAIAARDALADTWSKANERVAVLSTLCRHAVDLEWIERNPVVDIPKLEGGEYEAWPDDKLLAFERACDSLALSAARTAYELAIGTGQRLGDCIAMRWSDFDGEYVNVVQEKTGAKISVYCPARLRRYLADLPRRGAHILAKNLTQPLHKRAVQRSVETVRKAIGALSGGGRLVPHGWRYTAAKQLADAGVSDADIQAVTGHKTLTMVQKYRAQANQKAASRRAQTSRERNKDGT